MQSTSLSMLALVLSSLALPPADGGGGDTPGGTLVAETQDLVRPMPSADLRAGITRTLFDRPTEAADVTFELDADPLLKGRTLVGWSSHGETFDFVPATYTRIPRAAGLFSTQPPELRALLEAPGVDTGVTLGVLSSIHGSLVVYGATIIFDHPEQGHTRYFVPLSGFSAQDSESTVIPALIAAGEIPGDASPFLPPVRGAGGADVLAAKKKPTAFNCILQTAACVGSLVLLATGCVAACASATPACIGCILLAGVTKWVCCSACHCWASRGVSISCGC